MRETITDDVTTEAVGAVAGVTGVEVDLDVMSDEQRKELAANAARRHAPSARSRSPSPAR